MTNRVLEDDAPSLPLTLVDALVFWLRNQFVFWLTALPIAGLGAGVTYVLQADRQFIDWRDHWGWDFLFVLIYAMFLDRWLKESLLDGATDCDETDFLRRSIVTPRFLMFATVLFVLASALSVLPWVVPLVLCTAIFALLALALPSFSAAEPLGLVQALRLGRPARATLIVLSALVAVLWMANDAALHWALLHLPDKPWAGPAMAAAQRFFDCVLIALAGHVLAALFRQLADWRQPEPDDHPYRDLMRARRKAPPN
jgi:hypothetical protein